MKKISALGACIIVAALQPVACGQSDRGFTLPAGDATAGQAAFVELGCQNCHTVAGVEGLSDADADRDLQLVLGGVRTTEMTYDELVTSIINPSHKLSNLGEGTPASEEGQSLMPSVNDQMTVTQLVDIVTFLEGQYELAPYEPTYYPIYGP
ncbi:MAG: c-type cytochrome [Pseudomonadota bacterium]